jgi:hypothetical protein
VLFDLFYVEFVVIDVFDKVCVLLTFFYFLQILELDNYSIFNINVMLYDVDLVEMNGWYAKCIDSEILFELCVCVVRNMLCELVIVLILKCVLIWLVGLLLIENYVCRCVFYNGYMFM